MWLRIAHAHHGDVLGRVDGEVVVDQDLASLGKLPFLGDLYKVPTFYQSGSLDLPLDPVREVLGPTGNCPTNLDSPFGGSFPATPSCGRQRTPGKVLVSTRQEGCQSGFVPLPPQFCGRLPARNFAPGNPRRIFGPAPPDFSGR